MDDQNYINYLKEEVVRHVALCMRGEWLFKNGDRSFSLRQEMNCYRRHISFMMNGLKKLGVSESERSALVNPIKKEV